MNFSISDLEQLSGVSTHTIRIWERRYNALDPARSEGNTRLYNDTQLRRLLNIVSLVHSGLKISQVCALNDQQVDMLLANEMETAISGENHFEFYISQLIIFGFAYNEFQVNRLLMKCITDYGMPETYKKIIYPLLVRLGLMWRRDKICPSQEHFLTSIIRQKIFTAIDNLPVKENDPESWLLFLPEDEDHEIGLLFANYMLRLLGHKVIYLGPKVPLSSVNDAMKKNNIKNMLLFVVRWHLPGYITEYLSELSADNKNASIYLAGNSRLLNELEIIPGVNMFRSLHEFEQLIKYTGNAS